MATFTVISVDLPPFLQSLEKGAFLETAPLNEAKEHSIQTLLSAVQDKLPAVWLPTYLSDGFEKERALALNLNRYHPDIVFPFQDEQGILVLTVALDEDYPYEYVANGAHEEIAVGQNTAYMIRGGWAVTTEPSGEILSVGWEETLSLKLVIPFRTHHQIVAFESRPANLITEIELQRMAESLSYTQRQKHTFWLPFLQR